VGSLVPEKHLDLTKAVSRASVLKQQHYQVQGPDLLRACALVRFAKPTSKLNAA